MKWASRLPLFLDGVYSNGLCAQEVQAPFSLDEERGCAEDDLPTEARVVRFRRHIDPIAVLRAAGYIL